MPNEASEGTAVPLSCARYWQAKPISAEKLAGRQRVSGRGGQQLAWGKGGALERRTSPVYQCRKALRRNMAVNCSLTRLNISWMAVVLPRNVALIFRPLGGMSHTCQTPVGRRQQF